EATAGDAVSVDIPVDLIRTLKAAGTATLQRATLGAIVFEKIELGLNVDNNKLRLHPVSSDLFGGAYRGDVQIDASGSAPVLSVNERIENVNVGELAQAMFGVEKVTGTINGTFRLSGRGNNSLAIQESLAGEIGIDLADGAFHGTDVWYQLRRARSKLKNEPPPEPVLPPKTDFSTASMSGTVTNGVVRNADLFAQLPYMQLTGTGDIDLVSATMDYVLQARILERPEFLGDVSQEEIDDFTSAVIPLRVTGPLASPNVKPDVERLIRDRVEEEIKDRLKDKLGDLFN
ncbi:MAG: AsmA-like C-terminal region-containing protein, partial [Pseudomonadota bacterium]